MIVEFVGISRSGGYSNKPSNPRVRLSRMRELTTQSRMKLKKALRQLAFAFIYHRNDDIRLFGTDRVSLNLKFQFKFVIQLHNLPMGKDGGKDDVQRSRDV
jgi:hypothetical protein